MKFNLVIGIPSYNEENTISNAVSNIDKALSLMSDKIVAQIVNSDNNSSDLTTKHFLNTPTNHQKISLKTSAKGKGENLKNILEYSLKVNADAVIFMDSDLAYIPEEWIKELTMKLMNGYDAAFTRRIPRWNNGDLTYHLTYPILKSLWNTEIHEPISGDFGFSSQFIRLALMETWDENILGYGVDFFFSSIASRLNWCEVILNGKKDHILRSYNRDSEGFITMNPKFTEVVLTVKKLILQNCTSKNKREKVIKPHKYEEIKWALESPPFFDNDIEELKLSVLRKYNSNKHRFKSVNNTLDNYFSNSSFCGITNKLWIECLRDFINSDIYSNQIDLIETIFLSRVVGFYYEILNNENWYSIVESNAKEFEKIKN